MKSDTPSEHESNNGVGSPFVIQWAGLSSNDQRPEEATVPNLIPEY